MKKGTLVSGLAMLVTCLMACASAPDAAQEEEETATDEAALTVTGKCDITAGNLLTGKCRVCTGSCKLVTSSACQAGATAISPVHIPSAMCAGGWVRFDSARSCSVTAPPGCF